MLEAQGRSIAEENGYTLSGDHYYGPWEDEIATALRTIGNAVTECLRNTLPPNRCTMSFPSVMP